MSHAKLAFVVRDALMRARGLALRQAERLVAELLENELEAIGRAIADPDHGPVLAKICDEIADRINPPKASPVSPPED